MNEHKLKQLNIKDAEAYELGDGDRRDHAAAA